MWKVIDTGGDEVANGTTEIGNTNIEKVTAHSSRGVSELIRNGNSDESPSQENGNCRGDSTDGGGGESIVNSRTPNDCGDSDVKLECGGGLESSEVGGVVSKGRDVVGVVTDGSENVGAVKKVVGVVGDTVSPSSSGGVVSKKAVKEKRPKRIPNYDHVKSRVSSRRSATFSSQDPDRIKAKLKEVRTCNTVDSF